MKDALIKKINNIDCLDTMKTMSDNYVDLIVTDPPYRLDIEQKCYSGVYATRSSHLDKIKDSFGSDFNPLDYLPEMLRVSKNGVIVWHSKALLYSYMQYAVENGYKWNLECWHKTNPIPAYHNHKLNDTEFAMRIYSPGSYFNNNLDYQDYFTYYIGTVQYNNGHPTPKPVNIIQKQISVFSKENDLIYDPFAGSGTMLLASAKLNRRYIGNEIVKEYCDIIESRLKDFDDQFRLF